MTKTSVSAPVFPPGRYGRRREPGGRRRWPVVALAALAAAAGLAISVKLYQQYADPDFQARVVAVREISDRAVTVDFEVRVPAGEGAMCTVRARDHSGTTVGQTAVAVPAGGPGQTLLRASHAVPTSAKPFTGDITGCGPVS